MRSFTIKLIVYSFFIAIIDYYWNKLMTGNKYIPHIWFIFAFFLISTIIFHFVAIASTKKKPQNFIRFYMGSTALRMMICLGLIIAFRFVNKAQFAPFALAFMAHYFLFTTFEAVMLLRHLKR